MSNEVVNTPAGVASATGGAGDVQGSNDAVKDHAEKLRKEKENWKTKALELESQLKSKVEAELMAKEQYKTLAEQRLKDLEAKQTELSTLKQTITDAQKINALKSELTKLGMKNEYMETAIKMVDLKTIAVDPDHNVVLGVDSAAKTLKETLPPLFSSVAPNVSHAAPQGSVKPLTIDDWKALPYDEKVKREKELYQAMGINIKP